MISTGTLDTFLIWDSWHRTLSAAVHDGVRQELRVAPELVPGKAPDEIRYQPALDLYQILDAGGAKTRQMTKAEMAAAQSYLERMAANCRGTPYAKPARPGRKPKSGK